MAAKKETATKSAAQKAPAKKAAPKPAAKPAPKVVAKSAPKAEDAAAKARYHIGYDDENKRWIIKKSGAKRIIETFKTKEEAMERAKVLAKNSEAKLSVQRKNGQFGKIY